MKDESENTLQKDKGRTMTDEPQRVPSSPLFILHPSAFILLFLVGCTSNSPSVNKTASLPFQSQEMEILTPKSLNLPILWEVLRQEWSSQTGASARFVEYDANGPVPQQSTLEAVSGGRLVLFPLEKLCDLDSQLSPLPATDREFDSRDIFKGLRERALSREQQIIASPISVPVLVCYYRKDLLRLAHRKPPGTWDEYYELINSLDSWAPGLTAVEPLNPEFRATTFFARSLAFCKHPENYSVWFDIDSAKPTLTSPGFVEALETARRSWSKLPPDVLTYGPADCRRQVLTGKAAIALSFETHNFELPPHSTIDSGLKDQRSEGIELGICRLPGSRRVYNRNSKKWDTMPQGAIHAPALCGFAGLAAGVILPSKPDREVAASNLLVSLASTSLFDQAFASLPKGPCRESQLPLASSWFGPELSSEEASQYTDAVAQSLRDSQLVFELPVIGANEFRRAVSDGLDSLLRGESDSGQTSNDLQVAFEAIVERLGRDAFRDSHRRGLGLSPSPKK